MTHSHLFGRGARAESRICWYPAFLHCSHSTFKPGFVSTIPAADLATSVAVEPQFPFVIDAMQARHCTIAAHSNAVPALQERRLDALAAARSRSVKYRPQTEPGRS